MLNGRIRILMLGPDPAMKGGMASVAESYLRSNLSTTAEVRYHATTVDGSRLRKLWKGIAALVSFPIVALTFKPHVVHIHFAQRVSFYRKFAFLIASKICRRTTLVHCHGSTFREFHDGSRLNALCIRLFLELADGCIVLSQSWKQLFAGYSRNHRLEILYNPVELSDFDSIRQEPHAGKMVLFMGRLGERKGTYDLLDAVPAVLQAVPGTRFVLAGDGDVARVNQLIREKGLEPAVQTVGWVRGEAKARYFVDCDVFLLPSYNEGVPVAVIEAMAASKPVVTTPVGGIPDAVEDGKHGYLVAPGDIGAIADRVTTLLKDEALRRKMGRENRARVEKMFSTATIVSRLLSIYEAAVVKEQ